MKAVLSSLLCFVFLQTQVWALHGGPVGASAATSVVGTYAGVLTPTKVKVFYSNAAFAANSDVKNALGIFLVAVPQTGASNGNFLLFDSGEAFAGTVIGITDPRTLEFKGVVTGPDLGNNSNGIEFFSPLNATGRIDAFVTPTTSTTIAVATGFTGTAHIDEQGFAPDNSPDGVGFTILKAIDFAVDGFQQSTQTGNVTIPTPSVTSLPTPTPKP